MSARLLASGLLTLAVTGPAAAQTARVTGDPTTINLPNGAISPLSVDNQGRLWLANPGSGGGGTASTVTANQGAAGSTAWPVTLPSGQSVNVGNFPTTQAVSGTVALGAGSAAIGSVSVSNFPASQAVTGTFFQATQPISAASLPLPAGAATSANQAAPGTAGSPSTQVLSVQGVSGGTPQPSTLTTGSANIGALGGTSASGGVTGVSRIVSSAASTNATSAKTAQGRLYKVFACNTSTSAAYIRFYNLATAPTVGTSTVVLSRPVPPAGAVGGLACASYDMSGIGWFFSTGIAYAITAGAADSDTTALTAGQIVQVSVEYQ